MRGAATRPEEAARAPGSLTLRTPVSPVPGTLNVNFLKQSTFSSFKVLLNDSLFNYQHQLASHSMNKWFSAYLCVQSLLFVPKYSAGTGYINKETSIFNCHMRCKSFRWIFHQQTGCLEDYY